MKEKEWKNEVFLTLLKRNNDVSLSSLLEETKSTFNHLHDNYEELEDLSSGPMDFDLNKALQKVAFEIKNDRSLAGQIRQLFANVTYDRLMKKLKIDDPRADEQSEIIKLADQLAQEMLTCFTDIAEFRNKEV